MESPTRQFVRRAEEGHSVFLPEVRRAYRDMSEANRLDLHFFLTCLDGEVRKFALSLPLFAACAEAEQRFVLDFVLAQTFNLLSCLGGSELRLRFSRRCPEADAVGKRIASAFATEGYANAVRVADRMLAALYPGENRRFSIAIVDEMPPCRKDSLDSDARAADILHDAAQGLDDKILLGVDIGGTDIKLALAVKGRLKCVKEFDWFPTAFISAEEFIAPISTLVRLMAACAAEGAETDAALTAALSRHATVREMESALEGRGASPVLFDAIGMAFPDVVVDDRIVGGESPKTLGMRQALGDCYEQEFAELTNLAATLGGRTKNGNAVFIVNDGSLAAFAAGVELAQVRKDAVARGVLAHSLGTDFGTGWVTAEGTIPNLPLEAYGCIIDLGSYPERNFPANDARSINNFNHGLPGTMQKFAGQSGVFRLAMKTLPSLRPDLYAEITTKQFIVENSGELIVPTEPADMWKPFLEYLTALASRGDCREVEDVFREVGRAIGMVSHEIDWIVKPGLKTRTLFGRLVKMARCFELMREGAAEVNSRTEFEAADDNMANTELMRALAIGNKHTVAQFAQAVGAVHYANSRLGVS